MDIRSFLAFELPPDMKRIVSHISGEIGKSTLDVRRVKVENIHLTMVFMGNMKEEDIDPIGDEVQKVCLRYRPFDVSLKDVGCFPDRRNPRVLWLGFHGDTERMSGFRDELQRQLKHFGIKEEKRRFTPHLTLGRFRKAYKRDPLLDELLLTLTRKNVTSPVCALDALILFKSALRPGGAEYTRLGSYPLRGEQ